MQFTINTDNRNLVPTRSVLKTSDLVIAHYKGKVCLYGFTITNLKDDVNLNPLEARKTVQFLETTNQIEMRNDRYFWL